jgi:hypothetical protein
MPARSAPFFDSIFKQPNAQGVLIVIASEAKQSMRQQRNKSGLLRFARNDGEIQLPILAA